MPAGRGNRLGNAQVEPCISPIPIFTRRPALTVAMHYRVRACVRVHVVWCMTSLFFSLHGRRQLTKKNAPLSQSSRSVCMCLSSALANCALKRGAHHDALNHCADGLNLAVTSSVPAAHSPCDKGACACWLGASPPRERGEESAA
jgi:hypothetical protein